MTERHIHRSRFILSLAVAALLIILGCSTSKKRTVQNAPIDLLPALTITDSLKADGGEVVTQLNGKEESFKKIITYPYLTIRFKQEDTEVEMVLDPMSTNLVLDLKRSRNWEWEVLQGDSALTRNQLRTPPDSLNDKIYPLKDESLQDLTDEIVRDINLAQQLFYQRRYEEALRILNQSLQKKPTAAAYALGGSIYFVNGDVEQAVRAWENALKINPGLDDVKRLVARYKK